MGKPVNKIVTFLLRVALVILLYGFLFKVMHWPYAKILMLYGSLAILILYGIRFLLKRAKRKLDYIKLSIVLLLVFSYIVSAFHLFYRPYVLEVILLLLFIWWFMEEGLTYFTSRTFVDNNFVKFFYYVLSISSLSLVIIGGLFKILHWPYGALIFTLGVLLLSFVLILDVFVIKKKSN